MPSSDTSFRISFVQNKRISGTRWKQCKRKGICSKLGLIVAKCNNSVRMRAWLTKNWESKSVKMQISILFPKSWAKRVRIKNSKGWSKETICFGRTEALWRIKNIFLTIGKKIKSLTFYPIHCRKCEKAWRVRFLGVVRRFR